MPLNSKWSWEKIEAKIRELWGQTKYFNKPKPPGPDKAKLKKELSEEQLKEAGMKLDDEESFYYELNRLAAADEAVGETARAA